MAVIWYVPLLLKDIFPINPSQARLNETGKEAGEEPTDHDDVIDLVAEARRRIGDFATVDWIRFAPDLVRGVEDTLRQLEPGRSLGSLRGSLFNSGIPDSPESAEPPPDSAVPSPSETLSVPGMSRSSSSGSSAAHPPQPTSIPPGQAAAKTERPIRESARRKVSQPKPSLLVTPPSASVSMPPPGRTSPGRTSPVRISPTSTPAAPVLAPSPTHLAPAGSSLSTLPSNTQDRPAVGAEKAPTVLMGERPPRHLWRAVSSVSCILIDPLGSSLSFQCRRCQDKRVRCVPTSEDTFPYGACYHCTVQKVDCVRDLPTDVASEAAMRHRTVDYHAPPGSPPAAATYTIPLLPNLFHFMPEAVPLYGNRNAPLRELLHWYEEIYSSRREVLDSRAAHDAAIARKAADKKAYDASCSMERTARDRVHRADARCLKANGSYSELSALVFLKDKAVSDPAAVKVLHKKRKARTQARSSSDPKGKGKNRMVDIVNIDDELEEAGERSGSGEEDVMDLGQ